MEDLFVRMFGASMPDPSTSVGMTWLTLGVAPDVVEKFLAELTFCCLTPPAYNPRNTRERAN
ncbi:MAG TPA: hypothetical protein VJ719_13650 [Chthoniobacterales bacterium]|nr:hypothetical protein [Chthoniobacterales bacterium]